MTGNFRNGEIGESTGGHIVHAGLRRFAEALNLEVAKRLLLLKEPETRTNNFAKTSAIYFKTPLNFPPPSLLCRSESIL